MQSHRSAALACSIATSLLAIALPAQTQLVAPIGSANSEGNSNNAFPWNTTQDMRVQFVYDSSVFTVQGATQPVLITQLRYRADNASGSWPGGTYPQVQIELSTCPVDHLALSTLFANNQGADRVVVFQGPVVVQAGATSLSQPGPWHIAIPLAVPFLYDPNSGGDLCVDIQLQGRNYTGGARPQADHVSVTGPVGPALCSRVFDNFSGNANGTSGQVGNNYGAVCEFTLLPGNGLVASFQSTTPRGTSPLQVQFTDRSFSSDPGGVTAWAWDFDGDSIVDSTLQNPSFTYGCGRFDVSLTVSDQSHGTNTRTRPGYVVVDELAVDLTINPGSGGVVQFFEQTGLLATNWAWDFDDDGNIDSTAQNPTWTYPPGCIATTVSLSAWRGCGPPNTARRQLLVPSGVLTTVYNSNLFFGTAPVHLFDVDVLNPLGVDIAAICFNSTSPAGIPFDIDVFVTPGTFQGNDTRPERWRQVAVGSGTGAAVNTPSPAVLERPFHLAPGIYGMALHVRGINSGFTNGSQPTHTFANQHLRLTLGATRSDLWTGTLTGQRVWNGTLCYDIPEGAGRAGIGFFGLGCAGTLLVATQAASGRPRLGSAITLTVDHLPASAVLQLLGVDRRSSAFGMLPLDLSPLGAPGCFARVRADLIAFAAGSNGSAAWSLSIPNSPALQAQPFFVQPLVFDAAGNALGAVMGDAWAGVIGR